MASALVALLTVLSIRQAQAASVPVRQTQRAARHAPAAALQFMAEGGHSNEQREGRALGLDDILTGPIGGADTPAVGCFKRTTTRGDMGLVSECPPDAPDNDAGLCYGVCEEGYKGVGPWCWPGCPEDFEDIGALCVKPEPYTRGLGFLWQFGDGFNGDGMIERCVADTDGGGAEPCEVCGPAAFPKCGNGFHAVGCNVCTPDCPDGSTDVGAACTKQAVQRTVSTLGCAPDANQSGLFCYEACPSDATGVGPLCWQSSCAADSEFPVDCGALCAASEADCTSMTTTLSGLGWRVSEAAVSALSCATTALATFGLVAGCVGPTAVGGVTTGISGLRFFTQTTQGFCPEPPVV